jgi:hypothetical protein
MTDLAVGTATEIGVATACRVRAARGTGLEGTSPKVPNKFWYFESRFSRQPLKFALTQFRLDF